MGHAVAAAASARLIALAARACNKARALISYPCSEIRTLIPKLSLCVKLRTLRSDHRILVAIVVPLIPIVRTGFPITPTFFRLSVTVILIIRIFRTVAVAPIIGTDIESQHRDSDLQYCVHIRLVSDALVPKHKT